jgi:hypothetical protein
MLDGGHDDITLTAWQEVTSSKRNSACNSNSKGVMIGPSAPQQIHPPDITGNRWYTHTRDTAVGISRDLAAKRE